MPERKESRPDPLRCSFCRKPEHAVAKLISTPSDYQRAYICNECVAVCAAIIEDDRPQARPGIPDSLIRHPLASELIDAAIQCVRQESAGEDGSAELDRVRDLARRMARD
jgi:hypothetical protein